MIKFIWAPMVLKSWAAHKKSEEKKEPGLEEARVDWAKWLTGSLMGVPRCLLGAVVVLQIVVLLCLKTLPGPMPLPWMTSCTKPYEDLNLKDVTPFSAADYNVSCDLGFVYVYDLPEVFNLDLVRSCNKLNPWSSICHTMANYGLGELATSPLLSSRQQGSWYRTDQFTGELIHHKKILEHPCRTNDPELANAFYVPFYAGLAVGRYLWSGYSAAQRDYDAKQIIKWLQGQKYWNRHCGVDHFFMVGRITWDFRRSKDEDWGSSFLHMPEIKNATRLLIERNPWDDNEVGAPYPTAFHPKHRADVIDWQIYLRGVKRNTLFSFAGAGRSYIPNDFRGLLLDQCKAARSCRYLDCANGRCTNNSMAAVELFLDSSFCLQPRGDSFTRRSIFDCLIAGSIPVFFWYQTAYWQYKWHLPSDPATYSVFIPKDDVRNGTKIEDVLNAIPPRKIKQMREKIIRSIPGFIYSAPGYRLRNMKDAVDISVEGVLKKIKDLNLPKTEPIKSQ